MLRRRGYQISNILTEMSWQEKGQLTIGGWCVFKVSHIQLVSCQHLHLQREIIVMIPLLAFLGYSSIRSLGQRVSSVCLLHHSLPMSHTQTPSETRTIPAVAASTGSMMSVGHSPQRFGLVWWISEEKPNLASDEMHSQLSGHFNGVRNLFLPLVGIWKFAT